MQTDSTHEPAIQLCQSLADLVAQQTADLGNGFHKTAVPGMVIAR